MLLYYVDMLLRYVDMLLYYVDMLLRYVDMLLYYVDILFRYVDLLLRYVDILLCYVDILLRYVDMLFYYVVTYLISWHPGFGVRGATFGEGCRDRLGPQSSQGRNPGSGTRGRSPPEACERSGPTKICIFNYQIWKRAKLEHLFSLFFLRNLGGGGSLRPPLNSSLQGVWW